MELSFATWMEELASVYGDRPALTCGETLTYRELWDVSRRCAGFLLDAGLRKGDRVVLWAVNGLDWAAAFFGITMAGGVAVLMNYSLFAGDVRDLTDMVGAGWAVLGKNKVLLNDRDEAIRALIQGGVPKSRILDAGGLLKDSRKDSASPELFSASSFPARALPEETRVIIFTTGTTMRPKAVQLSSRSILSCVALTADHMKEDITDSVCVALPLFHSYGLAMMMIWLNGGHHVYLVSEIKAQPILDLIYAHQITGITTVNFIIDSLIRLPDFEEKLAGHVKICAVGGGFTTPTTMMRMENALQGGRILIVYGLTECSPIISVSVSRDPIERRCESVGRILPGLDVRIWRKGEGILEKEETGEIVVKGPVTMNGYLGLDEKEQPFDEEGWLHTGDLGRITEDGMLILSGRIKDIIIRSGENISPVEIEKALIEDPAISDVKVMGAPHPIWGESVEACVVPASPAGPLEEKTILSSLRNRLSSIKIPSHIFIYSAFPMNANGKLDQRSLKADMLERLRAVHIANALDQGLQILTAKVRNSVYTIAPVCDMVQGVAKQLSFSGRQISRIRFAMEEMLTDRVANSLQDNGEICVQVILMPQWLRIRFTDSGRPYRIDDSSTTLSARIILSNVDAFSIDTSAQGQTSTNLDWKYQDGFDIRHYLLVNQETGNSCDILIPVNGV